MPPDPAEPMVQRFVAKADNDLRAATILATDCGLADVVCFHCQQAVEKMLKAALLASGNEPPRTHDLGFLLETLETIRPIPGGLREVCAALADYGVAPRYPGWEGEGGTVDPNEALRAARIAVDLIGPLTRPATPE
jgi:HEPN domain-containing protein